MNELKVFTLLVLTMIHYYKPHGYMLMKIISELSKGLIRPGPGRIYPLLFILKQKELIREIEDKERRKRYELTEKGIAELREKLPLLREALLNLIKIVNETLEKIEDGGERQHP